MICCDEWCKWPGEWQATIHNRTRTKNFRSLPAPNPADMRCLKYWLLFQFFINAASIAISQSVGSQWIVAGQPYYKIPIAQAGTYQLTGGHFRRSGIDLQLLDPRTLQLFHRGREQAITITGESDGRFDPDDVLTFVGQANDGIPDSALYRPATAQPHPFYSLFSDTTYYFLTWRSGIRGLRQPAGPSDRPNSSPTLAETRVVLTTDYPAGIIYPLGASLSNGSVLSHYDEGEGWTGPIITKGQAGSVVLPLSGAVWADSLPIRLQGWVAGRNAWPHCVGWWVNGRRVGESVFENYETGRFSVLLPTVELGKPDALTVTVEPLNEFEKVSVSAVLVQYAQRAGVAPPAVMAPELTPVRFRVLSPGQANYLIISHPLLRKAVGAVTDPVREYAAYRASLAGGSYDTLTVNVGELFDLFTYGERSPLAIRRFAQFMYRPDSQSSAQPPLLFLIGQSRDPQGIRKNANAAWLDLVPNGGWPGSDALLVEGINGGTRDVPTLPVGRLNTDNPQTVLDYLAKVREHEAIAQPQLWRKNLLHLSGGRSADELSRFRGFVNDFSGVAQRPPLGASVQTIAKQTDEPVETIPIADLVNRGLGLITVFGHSGLDVTDVDIGFATDDRRDYHNRGRYPFLLVNGCASGNVFYGRPSFGTDWVTAPGRGSIGFLAHTYNGFPREMKAFSDVFYGTLTDLRWQTESIGRVHQETVRRYLRQNQTPADMANAQQFLLQGDPALRLFPFDKPDYAFGEQNQLTVSNDSLSARVMITNAGRAEPGGLPMRVRQYSSAGQLFHEQVVSVQRPLFSDTLSLRLSVQKQAGNSPILELKINPDGQVQEYDYDNNTLVLGSISSTELPFPADNVPPTLEVAFDGQQLENDAFVAPQPVISLRVRDDNPRLFRRDTTGLLLYLQRPEQAKTGAVERVSLRSAITKSDENGRSFRVDFRPADAWPDGRYQLEFYARDLSGNRAAPYRIGFQIAREPRIMTVGVAPNPFGGIALTTHTRFVCSLSGTTPPETIQLSITNLAGQLVRTMPLPGRIGTNEWSWNGTDEGGNLLPGGLYLYRFSFAGVGADLYNRLSVSVLFGRVLLAR